MNLITRPFPTFSRWKKCKLVAFGIVLGILLNGVRNAIILHYDFFHLMFSASSEWISYFGFILLAILLIHSNFRKLIRHGLLDQFRILPNERALCRRAIFLPSILIIAPALLSFATVRFIGGISYAGFGRALTMTLGLVSPSSGIIWNYTLSIYHIIAIVTLCMFAALPTWRNTVLPSSDLQIITVVAAIMIPKITLRLEDAFAGLPSVVIQSIMVACLILAFLVYLKITGAKSITYSRTL